MGESLTEVRAEFNGSIRIEARPERLTSDAGALPLREALERLGMLGWLESRLPDERNQKWITYPLIELVTTAILLLTQGYRDHDDADALRADAALRLAVSKRKGTSPLEVPERPEGVEPPKNPVHPEHLASQPTLSRLTAMVDRTGGRKTLREGLVVFAGRRIRAMRGGHRYRHLTVDVDSLPIEVHGHQAEAAYNGHYHVTMYHPLVATVAETGDLLDVDLRRGNAHTAEGGLEFIEPLLDRVEKEICQVAAVRIDAGFPDEKLLGGLERRGPCGTPYVARVKNNAVLDRMAEPYLHRPPGRRPKEPRTWLHEMTYRAESWSRERRVVLVVQEREDDLFLHHFWLITNWTQDQMDGQALLEEYRERGTAEGHMGELMSVLKPALSSTERPKKTYAGHEPAVLSKPIDAFAVNEVRLLLNAWAYEAMHVCRTLVEKATGEGWGLQRFRERCLKVAARVLLHARYVTVVIASTSADLWGALWQQLGHLTVAQTV
jgi:hypothetical protein